ncbi:MAG TPA: 2TM domain-containing protein [Solirubrobacteraceae bacterium]|nr:2TM domain-containing protein [Solirubrobacteraceae bacterium]
MASDGRADEQSRRRIKQVRDFAYHLATYVFVNALFVILDVRGGVGDHAVLGLDWAYWLILFWGFGVVAHAVAVFLGDDRAGWPHGGHRAHSS